MTDFVLTLRWTCLGCGWACEVEAPGFAGDGAHHYPTGGSPCGPLIAQRADHAKSVADLWLTRRTPWAAENLTVEVEDA